MDVYGYARVSTEEQVKSGSLNQQIDKIKDYCERNDHKIDKLFTDAGVSAIKERPEFEKMMETVAKGNDEIDGIVVTKLDRFGRSVKDLVINMETLQEEAIDFISIGDSLDTSTPNGKLLFHILSAFAEFEREIIRERMQAGRERARAEGKELHRPKKELDKERIKKLYTEKGLSARAIAKLMDVSPPTILSRLREMGVEIKGGA
ncbi:recombinase family protein [Candidatus Bipolaricaulota bacterium]|nr:recombinase family protein [Candidatus Bipolaricaulota bacterium]